MFVGMDIHKNYLQIAIMDNKGKINQKWQNRYNNLDKLNRYFNNSEVEQQIPICIDFLIRSTYNIT